MALHVWPHTFERLKQEDFRWDANKFYTESLSQKKLMKSTIHLHPLIRITVYPSAACPRPTRAHPLVWPRDMGIRSTSALHCSTWWGSRCEGRYHSVIPVLEENSQPLPSHLRCTPSDYGSHKWTLIPVGRLETLPLLPTEAYAYGCFGIFHPLQGVLLRQVC